MTEKASKIKKAIENYKERSFDLDDSFMEFKKALENDINKTLKDKYGDYCDFIESVDNKPDYIRKMEDIIEVRSYMFDSLVFRYEKARDAQMRYEQIEGRKSGDDYDGSKAKTRANRDKMRFIQILDEAIGVHN